MVEEGEQDGGHFLHPLVFVPAAPLFFFSAELGRLGCSYPFIDQVVRLSLPHSGGRLS